MTPPAKKKGRPSPPKNRKRITKQYTLSPDECAIVDRWVERAGDGTASMHVGMAIRYAERMGLFDHERIFNAAGNPAAPAAPAAPESLEEAAKRHAVSLIARLGVEALKPPGG